MAKKKKPSKAELARLKLKLQSQIKGFEASHPALVETVNELLSELSRLGI